MLIKQTLRESPARAPSQAVNPRRPQGPRPRRLSGWGQGSRAGRCPGQDRLLQERAGGRSSTNVGQLVLEPVTHPSQPSSRSAAPKCPRHGWSPVWPSPPPPPAGPGKPAPVPLVRKRATLVFGLCAHWTTSSGGPRDPRCPGRWTAHCRPCWNDRGKGWPVWPLLWCGTRWARSAAAVPSPACPRRPLGPGTQPGPAFGKSPPRPPGRRGKSWGG